MKDSYVAPLSRERVASIGLSATTLVEIQHARQLIREWQAAHPDEPKMYDVFEQLYMMEDAAHTIAAEREDVSHPRAAMEAAA